MACISPQHGTREHQTRCHRPIAAESLHARGIRSPNLSTLTHTSATQGSVMPSLVLDFRTSLLLTTAVRVEVDQRLFSNELMAS